MASATLETAAATVRAVCTPYSEISPAKVDCISEIIQNQITDDQLDHIREIVQNRNATAEPPMSISDACKLLGISKQALHYHCRQGHIRRCSISGALHGRGVVAADVRAIVEGKASIGADAEAKIKASVAKATATREANKANKAASADAEGRAA